MKKAFLVGINKYHGAPLRGCINDVITMYHILTSKFGFNKQNIKVITDYEATKENIIKGIKWLTTEIKSKDSIVFHYSGHGSQVMVDDITTTSEADGRDEIICVGGLNYISTDIGLVTAKELHQKLLSDNKIKAKVGNEYFNIKKSFKTEKDKYIKITTSTGRKSIYGLEHPLFIFDNGNISTIKAKNLTTNMKLIKQFGIWDGKTDIDIIWLLIGLFIGNGCFYSKHTISFNTKSDIKYLLKIVKDINKLSNTVVEQKYNSTGDLVIYITNEYMCNILRDMGFIPEKHRKYRNKSKFYIPMDESKIKSFIKGVFASGIDYTTKTVNFMSNDYELTKAISIILDCFGINNMHTIEKYNYITIDKYNMDNFLNRICFKTKEKNKVIEFNIKPNNSNKDTATENYFETPGFKLSSVKDIELVIDSISMFDFSVDTVHKFESDGLLVHNCPIDLDWNNPLRDHELGSYFKRVPKECTTLVILDSCHSGSGLRNGFEPGDKYTDNDYVNRFISPPLSNILSNHSVIIKDDLSFDFPDPIIDSRALKSSFLVRTADQGDAILIAGCQDNQTSADAYISKQYRGAMTYALAYTLNKHSFNITYKDLITDMNMFMDKFRYEQNPQLECQQTFFNKRFLK